MVRPRGPEGLGGRLVDLRSVAQDHGPHEAALRPRAASSGAKTPRAPLAQGGRRTAAPGRPPRVAPLEEARGLAVPEGRQALAHALGPAGAPAALAQTATRSPSRRRGFGHSPPTSTRARPTQPLDSALDLRPLRVDDERQPPVPLDGVPAHDAHDPRPARPSGGPSRHELPQAARLELRVPRRSRPRRPARAPRRPARRRPAAPPEAARASPSSRAASPTSTRASDAPRLAVHQQAAEAERRGEARGPGDAWRATVTAAGPGGPRDQDGSRTVTTTRSGASQADDRLHVERVREEVEEVHHVRPIAPRGEGREVAPERRRVARDVHDRPRARGRRRGRPPRAPRPFAAGRARSAPPPPASPRRAPSRRRPSRRAPGRARCGARPTGRPRRPTTTTPPRARPAPRGRRAAARRGRPPRRGRRPARRPAGTRSTTVRARGSSRKRFAWKNDRARARRTTPRTLASTNGAPCSHWSRGPVATPKPSSPGTRAAREARAGASRGARAVSSEARSVAPSGDSRRSRPRRRGPSAGSSARASRSARAARFMRSESWRHARTSTTRRVPSCCSPSRRPVSRRRRSAATRASASRVSGDAWTTTGPSHGAPARPSDSRSTDSFTRSCAS